MVPHGAIDQQETAYAVIKFADMNESMQQHAVDCVAYAFGQKRVLDDIGTQRVRVIDISTAEVTVL